MGITIVQKSDLQKKKPKATKALILAGGAVTGGSFKAGGLKALNDYLVGFQVTDFDLYVGISSGSLLAAPLMGGIPPHSILRSLDGTSKHFTQLRGWHYYRPNIDEFIGRPIRFFLKAASWIPTRMLRVLQHPSLVTAFPKNLLLFLQAPSLQRYDDMLSPLSDVLGPLSLTSFVDLLPSGLFDNRPIEHYIRTNIERNGLTNDFNVAAQMTGKRLYICAMTLDGAKRVIFGPGENTSATISEAVMASTAMPGFYRPASIRGIDYVDGGVQETADIDIAIRKGAQLLVCYNPFRPYEREQFVDAHKRRTYKGDLAAGGIFGVLNQIFRAAFHARLRMALKQFERDPSFKGDIILIEPRPDDVDFFMLNPFSLRHSVKAAQLGFTSVRNSIEEKFEEVKKIFASYGIKMSRARVNREYDLLKSRSADDDKVRKVLEERK